LKIIRDFLLALLILSRVNVFFRIENAPTWGKGAMPFLSPEMKQKHSFI